MNRNFGGKYNGEDRDRYSRDRNDRNNEREIKTFIVGETGTVPVSPTLNGTETTNTRGVCSSQHVIFWSPRNFHHSTHYGESDVQKTGHLLMEMDVCDDGDKVGGVDDESDGVSDGD